MHSMEVLEATPGDRLFRSLLVRFGPQDEKLLSVGDPLEKAVADAHLQPGVPTINNWCEAMCACG